MLKVVVVMGILALFLILVEMLLVLWCFPVKQDAGFRTLGLRYIFTCVYISVIKKVSVNFYFHLFLPGMDVEFYKSFCSIYRGNLVIFLLRSIINSVARASVTKDSLTLPWGACKSTNKTPWASPRCSHCRVPSLGGMSSTFISIKESNQPKAVGPSGGKSMPLYLGQMGADAPALSSTRLWKDVPTACWHSMSHFHYLPTWKNNIQTSLRAGPCL